MTERPPNLAVLQIQVQMLREDLGEMSKKLEKTDERLDLLYALLNQGRGMKTLFVIVFSLFGVGGLIALLQALQPFLMKG